MDQLYAAGALEVFYTPVQMKKNRPGTLLTVVAPPDDRAPPDRHRLPRDDDHRRALSRRGARVPRPRDRGGRRRRSGEVRFKVARRDGRVLNAQPEFDDCAKLAADHGVPVKDVQAQALRG